jgi:hypothetical protein
VAVRSEFGPSLPALLEARGWSRRALIGAAVGLVVVAAVAWFGLRALRDREQLVYAGPPQFNLVFKPSVLHTAELGNGELAHLVGQRRNVRVELTVRAAKVPGYGDGDVIGGYLPVLAEQRLAELRAQYGEIDVRDEGKARVNLNPGYQIGFEARSGEGRLFGRDAYVFPDTEHPREGVLLSMRRRVLRRQSEADETFYKDVKAAFSSFNFGDSQP